MAHSIQAVQAVEPMELLKFPEHITAKAPPVLTKLQTYAIVYSEV